MKARAPHNVPRSAPTLTASEIGTFAFCPQAWYLQRRGASVTPAVERQRRLGSRAHRKIGRQTNLIRIVGIVQAVLLLLIALGLLALAALAVNERP